MKPEKKTLLPPGEGTRDLHTFLKERIEEMRTDLEDQRNDEARTAAIRGGIAELREVLSRFQFPGA